MSDRPRRVSHRTVLIALNGVFVALLVGVFTFGLQSESSAVVAEPTEQMRQLEAAVAANPNETNLANLASVYVENEQPGMALAALHRSTGEATPEMREVEGRALLIQGEAHKALAVFEELTRTCQADQSACPSWILAKSIREREFLSELVRQGIEDPSRHPEATRAAIVKSYQVMAVVADAN